MRGCARSTATRSARAPATTRIPTGSPAIPASWRAESASQRAACSTARTAPTTSWATTWRTICSRATRSARSTFGNGSSATSSRPSRAPAPRRGAKSCSTTTGRATASRTALPRPPQSWTPTASRFADTSNSWPRTTRASPPGRSVTPPPRSAAWPPSWAARSTVARC